MWIVIAAVLTMADQLAEIRALLMSNQEKIDSVADAIAAIRNTVVKIHDEVKNLKANPPAEPIDFSRLDALVGNLREHADATDGEIEDLPAA
ncbi:hypothetical protein [Nocardia sp. NPDC050435]|uniref:hypothetical protein n=1 Tax=Nocardia sp. NPDC050435 TaxID=3155040 RepID=UPI0033C50566